MGEEWLIEHVLAADNLKITVRGSKVEHHGATMSTAAVALNQCPQGQVPHARMSFVRFYFCNVNLSNKSTVKEYTCYCSYDNSIVTYGGRVQALYCLKMTLF